MTGELGARQVRMVYLITYSQVENSVNICSSRENFAGKVLSAFRSCGIKVSYWICGRERCQDGGHRYHMSVRLHRSRRWLRVKKNLETEHNMFVNFSSIHVNYYTAYKYVVKEDGQALHSPGHPEVTNCIPKSTAASRKRTGSSISQSSMEHAGKKRPRTFDVSQIVEQHNINTEIQLQTLIKQEKQDDLAELTINRGAKCVEEAIAESIPDLSSEAVLVQVKASVLSVPDFQVLQELGISQQRIPIGREIAGIVKEVGADVTRFKQGDEVVGVLPLDANCSGCAEFCPVNEYDLAIKPKGVSFTDAAAVIGDAIKSYTALYYQGRICAGETILVTDVKEAGSISVQLAHHWGAKVIAIAHTEKERSHLESLKSKIAHVIEMEGQKNFAILNECLEETGGLGVDCVLDNGVNMFPNDLKEGGPDGGQFRSPHPSKHELISCLAVGGRWITGQKNLQLDPPDSELLYLKGASVHFLNPDVWTLSSAQQGRYLHILHDSMEKLFGGHIRPTIIQRIALDQVPIWYQRASQKTIGKVVVEL